MHRLAVLTVIAVFVLAGCWGGGDGGGTPARMPPSVDVTGTWDASLTIIAGESFLPVGYTWTGVFTMDQSDNTVFNTVSGTFSTPIGGIGQISGYVSGDEVSFTSTQGTICSGFFNGFALVNAASNQMSGTYSGVDCSGTLQASFTATKR